MHAIKTEYRKKFKGKSIGREFMRIRSKPETQRDEAASKDKTFAPRSHRVTEKTKR